MKLYAKKWREPHFDLYSTQAKLIYLYFLALTDVNYYCEISFERICFDNKMSFEDLKECIKEVDDCFSYEPRAARLERKQ